MSMSWHRPHGNKRLSRRDAIILDIQRDVKEIKQLLLALTTEDVTQTDPVGEQDCDGRVVAGPDDGPRCKSCGQVGGPTCPSDSFNGINRCTYVHCKRYQSMI